MPISFSNIPENLRIPLYWVEVDPSMAGLPTIRQPSLLVGSVNALSTAPLNKAIAVGTQAQADHHFGKGSELARMFKSFFKNNFANEVWGLPVPEPVDAIPAEGTIMVAASQTEAGTIHLYVGGQHVSTVIGTTDTKAQVAGKIIKAINDPTRSDLPVIAEGPTPTVPFTVTGTGAGTALTVTNVPVGKTVDVGDIVSGTGVPAGTTIIAQTSGTTGSNGTYTTSVATTASNATLTITDPPVTATGDSTGTTSITIASVAPAGRKIRIGDVVTGTGVPAGTTVVAQQPGGTPGGDGTYTLSQTTTLTATALTFSSHPEAVYLTCKTK